MKHFRFKVSVMSSNRRVAVTKLFNLETVWLGGLTKQTSLSTNFPFTQNEPLPHLRPRNKQTDKLLRKISQILQDLTRSHKISQDLARSHSRRLSAKQ